MSENTKDQPQRALENIVGAPIFFQTRNVIKVLVLLILATAPLIFLLLLELN